MFRKAGFRIVVPASEECKIQGGRRSIQGMSNVPGKKQQKGWSLNPAWLPGRLKVTSLGTTLIFSPCSNATRWAIYSGYKCRSDIKDFLNSQLVFVGLTKEILTK